MSSVCSMIFFLPLMFVSVNGDGFLKHDPRRNASGLHANNVDFADAMASVMGCRSATGAKTAEGRLVAVEQGLASIWRVLPKDSEGNVEWRMMRYMAHRYFLQKSSLLIRGLEPARQVNKSHMGAAEILNTNAPSLVETVLEGKRLSTGFSFNDALVLVATMEQLIFDSETTLLEKAYRHQGIATTRSINENQLHRLLEVYMVHWMIGDAESIQILLDRRALLDEEVPHWQSVSAFARGQIKSLAFARQRAQASGHGAVVLEQDYSFEEAHEIVGGITNSFASYWEAECQTIKASLVSMDKTGTGRVRLSDFYAANADGEWRFGESEAYLRELGALDETSTWGGKQLIIPNYLQGANNCIVSTQHYFVCCVNECEPILNEVEDAVGGPLATPDEILFILGNVTSLEDEPPKLSSTVKNQLQRIAGIHGGKVPIHARLFAQWLHYVFPRECAFPHKTGTVSAQSPLEFGDNYVATESEVEMHASQKKSVDWKADAFDEDRWMSQWSEEEELIADYSLHLKAPWENSRFVLVSFAGGILLLLGAGATKTASSVKGVVGSGEGKAHFV